MAPTELWQRSSQRSIPIWLIVLALLLVFARIAWWLAPSRGAAPAAASLVEWVDAADAGGAAARLGKPILFDFTADWCPPCHQLDADVFRNPRLAAEINERFVPVRVVDRMQEEGRNSPIVQRLQQRYEVDSFPTVVIVRADGTEIARMRGFGGRSSFERLMERAR